MDLSTTAPTANESALLHRLFQQKIESGLPMKDTVMSSYRMCHPQEKNVHGFMFGGYLMREAYELAFANAMLYCQANKPRFVELSEITFKEPVQIGSVLEFNSQIVYNEGKYFSVLVIANVINPKTGEKKNTNTFHYTFQANLTLPENGEAQPLRKILPKTYEEAMKYLDAKRRLNKQ
jgi:acyl-coenzyme A thioesterase 9